MLQGEESSRARGESQLRREDERREPGGHSLSPQDTCRPLPTQTLDVLSTGENMVPPTHRYKYPPLKQTLTITAHTDLLPVGGLGEPTPKRLLGPSGDAPIALSQDNALESLEGLDCSEAALFTRKTRVLLP